MGAYRFAPESAPIALRETTQEFILDLRAIVQPDGDATNISISLTNLKPFKVKVPFEEMAPILNELRYASNLMMQRQRLKLDRGARKMMDLVEHALRPSHIEILIDPVSGDRIFILIFEDHAPMAIRMTSDDVSICIANLADVAAKSTN